MYELQWNDSYLIGNKEVDAEHKHLFEIAHSALVVVDPSKRKAKVKEMIQELYLYTKTHFSHEETYMKSIKYPYLKEHQKIHAHVIELMNQFILKLPSMSIVEFERELAFFVQTLIVQHIVTEDKKITIWLDEHKKKSQEKVPTKEKPQKKESSEQEEIIVDFESL